MIKLYVIATSSKRADELREKIDSDSVDVMDPPRKDVHIARKPEDGEMLIDLRKTDSDLEHLVG